MLVFSLESHFCKLFIQFDNAVWISVLSSVVLTALVIVYKLNKHMLYPIIHIISENIEWSWTEDKVAGLH